MFLWEAAKKNPYIEGTLWGNGFPGKIEEHCKSEDNNLPCCADWNANISKSEDEVVTKNVLKKYGQNFFDVVMIDIGMNETGDLSTSFKAERIPFLLQEHLITQYLLSKQTYQPSTQPTFTKLDAKWVGVDLMIMRNSLL